MSETNFQYQQIAEPVIGGPEDLGQLLLPKWVPAFPDIIWQMGPRYPGYPAYFFGMQFTGDPVVVQIDRWIPTYPDVVMISWAMSPDGMEPQGISG